jgi:molybdenum cofactor guanylyltransferase
MTVPSNPSALPVTGLILAGGRATRMQERDKGLQQLLGVSLVERVIARLLPQVDRLAINANRNLPDYARFGLPVWPDLNADFNGPLAGLETGLTHCQTPYLLCVPCDCPFLPLNLGQGLMTELKNHNADLAVATCADTSGEKPGATRAQPAFCLVHRAMLPRLQRYLQQGGRRMDGWYGDATVARVHFDDPGQFENINTIDELNIHADRLRDQH